VEYCNQLPVHPRHPYAGDLVYTSFSGSHQDAIKKAFAARRDDDVWVMPYLPLDPKDLGRSYEAVIRVNSQSGKGGISYLLEAEYGLELPRRLQIEFSQVVQTAMDATGKEFTAHDIFDIFEKEYGLHSTPAPRQQVVKEDAGVAELTAQVQMDGHPVNIQGKGNGPIDAFVDGLAKASGQTIRVVNYHEHSVGTGSGAQAVAYLELCIDERTLFGVGMDSNIVSASLKAITSGLRRSRAGRSESVRSGA
jgi:2-isopropylmalate synthase